MFSASRSPRDPLAIPAPKSSNSRTNFAISLDVPLIKSQAVEGPLQGQTATVNDGPRKSKTPNVSRVEFHSPIDFVRQ